MNQIFIQVLNQSINAVYLILAVLVIRLFLKKAPKWIACALWGLVALKLILPFSPESVLSLVPSREPIPQNIEYTETPHIETGISVINHAVNPIIEKNLSPNPVENSVNPMQVVMAVGTGIWLAGMGIMLAYFLISFLIMKKRVAFSQRLRDGIYIGEEINGPFILGVIRPKIYLPAGLSKEKQACVLEHEMSHIRRLDHLWKPLGYLILTVYWFQPLCWVSYILLCKDIELACDEKVTKDKDKEWKAMYCQTLLDCAVNSRKQRRIITACPVAFGEVGIQDRVKSVLNYKRPAFWILIVAFMVSIAAAVCFATSPVSEKQNETEELSSEQHTEGYAQSTETDAELTETDFSEPSEDDLSDTVLQGPDEQMVTEESGMEAAIRRAIREHNSRTDDPTGILTCVSFVMLGNAVSTRLDGAGGDIRETYYGWAMYEEYLPSGFRFANVRGTHMPVVISFDVNQEGEYSLAEYWEPVSGTHIREKVPDFLYEDMEDYQKFILVQKQDCYDQLVTALYADPTVAMEGLLTLVTESPKEASDPQDYLDAHPDEYREMIYYGTHALQYCFSRFETGGETGLEGQIMMYVCRDIMASMGEALILDLPDNGTPTGQAWYDAFRKRALQLGAQYAEKDLAETYPASALLLEMIGES